MNIGDYSKHTTAEELIKEGARMRAMEKIFKGNPHYCQRCYTPLRLFKYSGGMDYISCEKCN